MYRPAPSFLLAKNVLLNILFQFFLALISICVIPILVNKVGDEKFSIILLSWTIIGYFNSFDLGIGRAVSHYVSKYLAINKKFEIYGLLWSALLISLLWGLTIIVGIVIFSRDMVNLIFKLSISSYDEVNNVLKLIAFGSVFVLMQSVLRSYLMSFQKFNYINLIQSFAALLQWLGSLITAYLGFDVLVIVAITVIIRILTTFVFFISVKAVSRDIFKYIFVTRETLKKLIEFGIWVGISQMIGFILIYADRFFISSMISTRMSTYFVVPSEITTRILYLIPGSFALVLFPALTERATLDVNQTHIFYNRLLKYLYVIMYPLSLTLFFGASEILNLWVGDDFVIYSASVLKILSIGLFINSIAQIPLTAIQSLGRPDITTKFQIIEFPIYIVLCILLIPKFGINGAAIAGLIRVLIESFLSFSYMVKFFKNFNFKIISYGFNRMTYLSFSLLILYVIVSNLGFGEFTKLFIYLGLTFAFWIVNYHLTFDNEDKTMILKMRDAVLNYINKTKTVSL